MECPLVILEGAHFLTRERGADVNGLLKSIIFPHLEPVIHRDPTHYMVHADPVRVCLDSHLPPFIPFRPAQDKQIVNLRWVKWHVDLSIPQTLSAPRPSRMHGGSLFFWQHKIISWPASLKIKKK
jgi:hypothetical protein